ncbi:hypothetical protein KP509_32G016100 [Ceratopteris richardii]|nr:hypothetical protein KP509_32G016100 [Ceratopteris richardii]
MANEVMMLLNHVRTLEQQHLCNMSLIETLQVELDEARSQLQMLQENQRKFQFKAEAMKTRIAEERSFLKEQEENYIKITVKLVIQELESERKSKQKLEGLYKKAAKEFRLARKSLGKALEDLEREKKARKLMEEVCDELAREIGQDKARVKELKLESLKVREEVEEERRMLQMAEIWREERVRMKLMEAKLELEGKNAALDKLRGQLEIFLKTRMVDHVKSKVVIDEMMDSHHLTSGRHSVDSSSEQQTKQSEQFNGVYADDELHSIEVNCQSLEQVQEIETQKSTQMDFKENTETEDGDKANMFPEVAHC